MNQQNIENIIKAAMGALNLKDFKGDIVAYKHVETQWNVAEGANVNIYNNGGKQPVADESCPMAEYIMREDKVRAVTDWLRRSIVGQPTPKAQLAPLKAAMECRPRAVNSTLPCSVFNKQFGLNVSEVTYKNWILGYHQFKYDASELEDYIAELEEIMSVNE